MTYTNITTEGGLLPADVLEQIAAGELGGQRPEDFGLERGRNLSDRIAAAWQAARGLWLLFKTYGDDLRESDPGTTLTRQRWVLPLLDVLGYQLVFNPAAHLVGGRTYAVSHRAGPQEDAPPVHVEGFRTSLDARPPSGRPRLSPHALLQEYLNSTEQLWGIVTNGERLRLLRDSSRFTRPAYVEFDLRAIFEGEQFSAFALLYRLLHRTRLPQGSADAAECWLEQYHQKAVETGGRVREKLRDGVETALKTLGNGLLAHPANAALRDQLGSGQLSPLAYYRQLLRLVYRLLFLLVAEERGLIAAEQDETDPLSPLAYRPTGDARLAIYRQHYSVARLRRLAEQPGVGRGPYDDLWASLQTTFRLLEGSDERGPRSLGLAPLDGDLFGPEAIANLEGRSLRNSDLLRAVRALSLYHEQDSKTLRRVNYGALDVEELGSVYESLLDYRPVADSQGALQPAYDSNGLDVRFFNLAGGTERKTTGSYYTRPELVQELIKSALVPVLEERLKAAGPDPLAREQALLAITVCDPACGSGHFLLAAARRLGRELARVRSGEEQPTPAQFRLAVRDVIQHCIYGVDLNPLAVDLCKLALWIEGHSAGMPLSFLDHHVKQGNSLIGATRALVGQGIPDDAYKPVTGDDKKVATEIKKRNKAERERYRLGAQQHSLFDAPGDDGGAALAAQLRQLDAMAAGTVAEVRAKAARYQQARAGAAAELTRFNLWTAAFFQPLTAANAALVPTTQTLADHERRALDLSDPRAATATALAAEVGFFHWELEFPQVFAGAGGFDVVLGNPPWERIKLQEQEHFVDVPAIAGAANKAARERVIDAWRNGDPQQRARIAKFDAAKYRAEAESRFVRASERFPLTAVGDVNTYALFAEHSRNLIAGTGRAGIIVPTGIATDDTTKDFFGSLVQSQSLTSLLDFENREGLFPDVAPVQKFCLLTLTGSEINYSTSNFLFFATKIEHLSEKTRYFSLSSKDFALINPNTNTCPAFRTRVDANLAISIYNRVLPLVSKKTEEINRWKVRFFTMFHMANDSHLFTTRSQLTSQEYSLNGNLFMKDEDIYKPLYEAKFIQQYDHRLGGFNEEDENIFIARAGTSSSSQDQKKSPEFVILPRYWTSKSEIRTRIPSGWDNSWFIAFRDLVRPATDTFCSIFSVIPIYGIGHTAPGMISYITEVLLIPCLLSILNSLVIDYIAKLKIGGSHFTYGILNQLPVLPPDRFTPDDIAFIVPRVVELVYTAWDIRAFAEDVWAEADGPLRAELLRRNAECNAGADPALFAPRDGFALPPYRWSDERRAVARAELDARIARLYGLTRDELRYILDPHDVYGPDFPGETFRVLKEKEIKQHGEYRTRRLVLEAWDREEAGRR